jgi:hypothetical protein
MATYNEAIYAMRRHLANLYSLFKLNNYIEFAINSDHTNMHPFRLTD